MGTHRPDASVHPLYRRAAVLGVGALPLSVAILCAVPAVAAPPAADPAALIFVADPATIESTALAPSAGPVVAEQPRAANISAGEQPRAANISAGEQPRAANVGSAEQPHVANIGTAEQPHVANIGVAAQPHAGNVSAEQLRIGDVGVDRPEWLTPNEGDQINTAAADAETALTQSLESAGIAPDRSARISADVLGSAAVGAVVGGVAASPIAVTGAVIGGVAGLVAGLPFAPAGLVVVPVIGAALGYAMVAAPLMAVGAAAGAAAGAVEGALAPLPADQADVTQ